MAGLMAVLVLAAAAWLRHAVAGAVTPAGEVMVEVPAGSGAGLAARRLADAGVVPSALGLRLLAAWRGDSRRLQAGEYLFEGRATPGEVLDRLVRGDVVLHAVTVPEGLTLDATVTLLQSEVPGLDGDLRAVASDPAPIRDLDGRADDLEGYLFPDTYRFPRGVDAGRVVRTMVERFRQVAADVRGEASGPGAPRGFREWVTLASLVEKETSRAEERDRVAGVFANRLRLGMPLQADPTVLYALADAGIPLQGSLARHLDVDSPYNTYRHPGLPPGPIANPGRAALEAAWRPEATDALYFVADGQGGHRFSRTLTEHNRAVRAWRESSRQGRRP